MALLLSFISCTSNVQELETEQLQLLKQIVMTTEDFEPEADSRTLYQIAEGAVKCSWASNDTVGVFPDKGMQTCFPMTSENGMKNATFDGGGWALKDGSTYGAYYPFIGNMYLDKKSIPVSYKKQTQVGNGSIAHLGTYDYMVATPVAPEFGSAHFTFKHLGVLVQLRLTIPQAATLTSMKLVTEIKAFALEGKVNIMADAPSISPIISDNEIELTLQDISTTEENQVVTLYMVLPPANISEQTLKAVVVSNKGTLEYVLENKNFQAGKAYALTGTIKEAPIGNGTYQNGVVSIAEAGTMKKLLGDDYLNITSLKVVGPINGDDVYYLRKMLGGSNFSEADWGKLTTLDLSEATIVEGGEWYYENSSAQQYYTSKNMVGDYMFYECDNLQNITLPHNITSIGNYAFYDSPSLLNSISIPNNVKTIGNYAFALCDIIESITIPDDVTTIGNGIFQGCSKLSNISIGNSISIIPEYAFNQCNSLVLIDIPNNVTTIESRAFYECRALQKVIIGNGVSSINHHAFEDCPNLNIYIKNLSVWCNIDFLDNYYERPFYNIGNIHLNDELITDLTIPKNVNKIKNCAFYGCTSIKIVTIPNNIVSIGDYAFEGSSAQEVNIYGNGNTSIGESSFSNCHSLENAYIDNGVSNLGEYAFLLCNKLTEISIGNGITSFNSTFIGCKSLRKVTIGNNVKRIGYRSFDLADYASQSPIEEFYCNTPTPPTLDKDCFRHAIKDEAILYVPSRCGSAYKSSDWGNHFKNIKEID